MIDYYNVLGVSKSASDQEIKSAYRKLAMQHHPDKGGDINKFQEISEAYEHLSNPDKRAAHDNPRPHYQNSGFDFNSGAPPGFEDIFGPNSPFSNIFGFRNRQPTNSNIQYSTSISLEDSFFGKEVIANVSLPSGREQIINIKIPQGVHEGTTLRLAGMGDDSIAGVPRGDILLAIHVQNHPVFFRSGDDLVKEVEINCFDAMLGKTIDITTINNKLLQTEIPAGIQHDTVLSLAGHGMPNFNVPSKRGRLLIKIKIKTPELSEDQKNDLRKINL